MTIVNLGNDDIIDTGNAQLQNNWYAIKITPPYTGTLNSIVAKITSNSVFTVKCAIYNWVADHDLGAYIDTTQERTLGTQTSTWTTFDFTTPVNLTASTPYYIVVWGNTIAQKTLVLRIKATTGTSEETTDSIVYGAWPNPMTGENASTSSFAIYGVFEYIALTYGFYSDAYTFSTTNCNIISLALNDNMGTKTFNFWETSDIETITTGLETKNIILEGIEKTNPYTVMAGIESAAEAGEPITLYGMKNSDLNTTWLIENFSYQPYTPSSVQWRLTLEKYY